VLRDLLLGLIRGRSTAGDALERLRRVATEEGAEAAIAYGRAQAARRDDPALQRELGRLLIDAARGRYNVLSGAAGEAQAHVMYEEAVAAFARSLAARPDPAVHRARGVALREMGALEAAHEAFLAAQRLRPGDPQCGTDLAFSHQCLGDTARALETYEAVIAAHPEHANAHAGFALSLLGAGEFERGWDEYEWRLRAPDTPAGAPLPIPFWRGEPLAGRSLLLRTEQGIGDEIMFASCIPDLLAAGARCIVECSHRLSALFARSFPEVRIVARDRSRPPDLAALGAVDLQCYIGSLPRWLRRGAGDFPGTPYLKADAARVDVWRDPLGGAPGGLRIGFAWTGGLPGTLRAARSLPPEAFLPLLAMENARFVALELADCSAELALLRERSGARIDAWPGVAADPDEAAALACALDAVVCVPTAAAHLAGALGRPVWVLVSGVGTWRYGWQGARMPWYGSMRLLRRAAQGKVGEVGALVVQAREALETLTRSAAPRPD